KITNRRAIGSGHADAGFLVREAEESARSCRHRPNFRFPMTGLPLNAVGGSDNYGTCYSHFISSSFGKTEKAQSSASFWITSVERNRCLPFESRQLGCSRTIRKNEHLNPEPVALEDENFNGSRRLRRRTAFNKWK